MTRFRSTVQARDLEFVPEVVRASGFFSEEEVAIAAELVTEAQAEGRASGYYFIFAEEGEPSDTTAGVSNALGFACYGPIPGSKVSFDLYWIVVAPQAQGAGLGRRLLSEAERGVARAGGQQLYADTSGRAQYAPTRAFYEGCGYRQAAYLDHFYDQGDDKVIYVKLVQPS